MKPILPTPEVAEIYLENFKQFGSALMECGGEPFRILKNHDEFLRTLALNNISVTAKYDGPEFKKEPTHYVDPKELVTKLKKHEDRAKEEYDAVSYDQKMTEEDWNSFGEYHNKTESKEKEDVKPNTLEIYPPDSEKGKPVYFLEIYNGERWKLCLRNRIDNFSVPKIGWFGEGHPYTLGEGKIAHEYLINMYTLSNLKRIVDGLNMQNAKESSPLPPTSFEPAKEKINWQKNYPYPITTSP